MDSDWESSVTNSWLTCIIVISEDVAMLVRVWNTIECQKRWAFQYRCQYWFVCVLFLVSLGARVQLMNT